jgi:hypothetical protein
MSSGVKLDNRVTDDDIPEDDWLFEGYTTTYADNESNFDPFKAQLDIGCNPSCVVYTHARHMD